MTIESGRSSFPSGAAASSNRTIVSHTLYSAHLGEERTVKVYLPPQVNDGKLLPVLYAHDGAEFFTHGRMGTIAHTLITTGQLPPLIIAGIAVRNGFRTQDYAVGHARNKQYKRFVSEECIAQIESMYPIDPHRRAMTGVSLGASVTLQLYLEYSQLFQTLLLFSGAYQPALQEAVQKETDLHQAKIWMVTGTDETAVQTPSGTYDFLQINRAMRAALSATGADVSYSEEPGTHLWGFWQRHLPNALHFLAASGML